MDLAFDESHVHHIENLAHSRSIGITNSSEDIRYLILLLFLERITRQL